MPTSRNWYDEQLIAQGVVGNIPCGDLLNIEEYLALGPIKTAANFDGLANARTTKPKRQVDADVNVVEKPAFVVSTGGDDANGLGQVEGAELRAKQGMMTFGGNTCLSHRFDTATLKNVLAFDAADRNSAFVKELKQTPLMNAGEFPRNDSGETRKIKRGSRWATHGSDRTRRRGFKKNCGHAAEKLRRGRKRRRGRACKRRGCRSHSSAKGLSYGADPCNIRAFL
jgi:hypothetical protein